MTYFDVTLSAPIFINYPIFILTVPSNPLVAWEKLFFFEDFNLVCCWFQIFDTFMIAAYPKFSEVAKRE
jgi:hypothetical protein